jgi:hypothetical protein
MEHLIQVLRGEGNLTCSCPSLDSAEVFARWLSKTSGYTIQVFGVGVHGVVDEQPTSTFFNGTQIE